MHEVPEPLARFAELLTEGADHDVLVHGPSMRQRSRAVRRRVRRRHSRGVSCGAAQRPRRRVVAPQLGASPAQAPLDELAGVPELRGQQRQDRVDAGRSPPRRQTTMSHEFTHPEVIEIRRVWPEIAAPPIGRGRAGSQPASAVERP
jgi:hypothetical protein